MTRLPGNCVFRVDFTDLTLALPELPPELDGLTILVLSDLHFHGTPARPFFDRIIDELTAAPIMMDVEFTERTKTFGWGSFDPAVWQEQIDLNDALKQFPAGKPKPMREILNPGRASRFAR